MLKLLGRPGGIEAGAIRVFPAVPARWREAAFEDLVAEGGHRVSARRENGATTWLKVIAGPSLDGQGEVRIRDNFGARTPRWNRETVRKSGEDYLVVLKPGEAVEGTFPNP